jgi:hypothetical protein
MPSCYEDTSTKQVDSSEANLRFAMGFANIYHMKMKLEAWHDEITRWLKHDIMMKLLVKGYVPMVIPNGRGVSQAHCERSARSPEERRVSWVTSRGLVWNFKHYIDGYWWISMDIKRIDMMYLTLFKYIYMYYIMITYYKWNMARDINMT